jgi:hypothetical protein
MLDPNNGDSYVGQFSFQPGATTANEQFAIDPNGNILLGDGLGGGTEYSSTSQFLSTFSLPAGYAVTNPETGDPYIFADPANDVFVFDGTGYHEYTSAMPEPCTALLMFLGIPAVWGVRRVHCCAGSSPV